MNISTNDAGFFVCKQRLMKNVKYKQATCRLNSVLNNIKYLKFSANIYTVVGVNILKQQLLILLLVHCGIKS